MIHSIYDGNTESVKIVKLNIEEEYINYPSFEFQQYEEPIIASINDVSPTSIAMTTYRARVNEIITRDRKRVKIVLDKGSQEIVDLFVEIETHKLKENLRSSQRNRNIEVDRLQCIIYELENTWYKKLYKRIIK